MKNYNSYIKENKMLKTFIIDIYTIEEDIDNDSHILDMFYSNNLDFDNYKINLEDYTTKYPNLESDISIRYHKLEIPVKTLYDYGIKNLNDENVFEYVKNNGYLEFIIDKKYNHLLSVLKITELVKYNHDFKDLKTAINFGKDINQTDLWGQTSLFYAVTEEDKTIVEYLLKSGIDFDKVDRDGDSALMKSTNIEITKLIVEKGADIDIKSIRNETALSIATKNGNTEIALYLIEKLANVNTHDDSEYSPLIYAAKRNNIKVVKKLIEYNADLHYTTSLNETVLDQILFFNDDDENYIDMVELLVGNGLKINFKILDSDSILFKKIKEKFPKEYNDWVKIQKTKDFNL